MIIYVFCEVIYVTYNICNNNICNICNGIYRKNLKKKYDLIQKVISTRTVDMHDVAFNTTLFELIVIYM